MSGRRCNWQGAEKPKVWRDEDGWVCDQWSTCLTCGDCDMDRLAKEVDWPSAIRTALAHQAASPTTPEEAAR